MSKHAGCSGQVALRPSRGWSVAAIAVVAIAGGFFFLRHQAGSSTRGDSPWRVVDVYVAAREQGDRAAMADVLGGNLELREAMLNTVDGHPVSIVAVSTSRRSISDRLFTASVTWSDPGHASGTDQLLVLPRQDSGSDPTTVQQWSVSVAP